MLASCRLLFSFAKANGAQHLKTTIYSVLRRLEDTALEDESSNSVWKSHESVKLQSAAVDFVVSDNDGEK